MYDNDKAEEGTMPDRRGERHVEICIGWELLDKGELSLVGQCDILELLSTAKSSTL